MTDHVIFSLFFLLVLEQNSHRKGIFFSFLSLSTANVIFWFIAVLLNLGFGCSLGSLKFNAVIIWINLLVTSTADCHFPLLLEMFSSRSALATYVVVWGEREVPQEHVGWWEEKQDLEPRFVVFRRILQSQNFLLLGHFLFLLFSSSLSLPTTNPTCEIISLKNSWLTYWLIYIYISMSSTDYSFPVWSPANNFQLAIIFDKVKTQPQEANYPWLLQY